MPEMVHAPLAIQEIQPGGLDCPPEYDLHGPQVEPEASWWLECLATGNLPAPRPITIPELKTRLNLNDPANHFPTDIATIKKELQELVILSRLRDEPRALPFLPGGFGSPAQVNPNEPQGLRLPLSMFLQLRPQPLGAVVNTARGSEFPVVLNGRELARYFESETPGLQFRLALNYMMREVMWSPPRQAWIWAALDITIYSALAAAWFLKWRGGPGIERRPRPLGVFP
jgi:hypothetical protein